MLLLVSADFLASDYCWGEEMTKALQRHERGEARVIPIILRPCRWRSTPLAKLQAVPRDGKPVTDWLSRDAAFNDVAAAIERIIEDQQQELLQAQKEQLRAEAEAKQKAPEEERKRREQQEGEAKRRAEGEKREGQWRERRLAEVKRQAEQQARRKAEGEKPKPGVSKWIVAAAVVLVVVLGAILVGFFRERTTVPPVTAEKERPVTPAPPEDAPKTPPPDVTRKTNADARQPAPDVATAEAPPTFRDCDDCPLMVALPGGSFMMGSPAKEAKRSDDEGPLHKVAIAPFAIGKTEVTFAEWDACVAAGGCDGYLPSDNGWGRGSRPVINVSWQDAQAYVAWLSERTVKPYRLPTEAEWEYAARAGTTTPFSFGATISTALANYDGNYTYRGGSKGEFRQQTVPAGSLPANPWGLHEVQGNVREWVQDCYHASYKGAPRTALTGRQKNVLIVLSAVDLGIAIRGTSASGAYSTNGAGV